MAEWLSNLFEEPSKSCSGEQQTAMSELKANECKSCHQNRGKAIFELKNYGDMINKYSRRRPNAVEQ